ncbi:MAG: N-acetylglucosamine-6-phosphate deacetylase [Clostridium sp.]|uniref:N-acetylglucosamine-6-phosphate deacetylase n=1 Tax=Clostridium sp. TaxID=1506 RepID=UPI0030540724
MIKVLSNTTIYIKDGKIAEVGKPLVIEQGYYAVPGFIDEHTHGGYGVDFMNCNYESIESFVRKLPEEGVTAFLATTITQSSRNIESALENLGEIIDYNSVLGAEILGIHLEGPFLNKKYKGAQLEDYILNPDISLMKEFIKASKDKIRKLTYAPELDHNYEFTKYLVKNNIIPSVGHSDGTFSEIESAVYEGLESVTHFHNGQSPHHHRRPGVVTAGLSLDELTVEIICDGIHLHRDTVKSIYKIKGIEKIVLVTDSMEAKGLYDGEYELGGQKVIKRGNEARLIDNTLAGSCLTMIEAVKNVIEFTGCSLEEAVTMASTNPARNLKILDRKGSLDIGKDCDIVILDEKYNIVKTLCKGNVVFSA